MNISCRIALFATLPIICFADGDSAGFEIIRGGYEKPLLWFKPSKDVDGNTPTDVLVAFWNYAKENDPEGAVLICIPMEDFDNRPNRKSSLREGVFSKYLESIHKLDLKRVRISEYPIKEKSGYWRVNIRLEESEGEKEEYSVYLKTHDGKWKIQETSGWYDAAMGKRRPFGLTSQDR